jgi:hypothetical protein
MSAPVSSPVIPVPLHPRVLAVSVIISIVRVVSHLVALPPCLPGALATLLVTVALVLYTRIGMEKTPA